MNAIMHPQLIFALVAGALAAATIVAGICIRLTRASRHTSADCVALALQLEHDCADLSRDLDAATLRANDLSRRIAWLESRAPSRYARPTKATAGRMSDDLNGQPQPVVARAGITERRHRVMRLATRGEDVTTIAGTLGMPRGEVELIINLNTVA